MSVRVTYVDYQSFSLSVDCSQSGHLYENLATVKATKHDLTVDNGCVKSIIPRRYLVNFHSGCSICPSSLTRCGIITTFYSGCGLSHCSNF